MEHLIAAKEGNIAGVMTPFRVIPRSSFLTFCVFRYDYRERAFVRAKAQNTA